MKPLILAIDPGTTHSGVVLYDADTRVVRIAADLPNREAIDLVTHLRKEENPRPHVCIEMIASYGMPVGRETFDTVLWIGRLVEVTGERDACLVYRKDIKLHLCGTPRAKDANIRQAILDRFGGKNAIGTAKERGPLYHVKGHQWAALAVALYAADNWPLPSFASTHAKLATT